MNRRPQGRGQRPVRKLIFSNDVVCLHVGSLYRGHEDEKQLQVF